MIRDSLSCWIKYLVKASNNNEVSCLLGIIESTCDGESFHGHSSVDEESKWSLSSYCRVWNLMLEISLIFYLEWLMCLISRLVSWPSALDFPFGQVEHRSNVTRESKSQWTFEWGNDSVSVTSILQKWVNRPESVKHSRAPQNISTVNQLWDVKHKREVNQVWRKMAWQSLISVWVRLKDTRFQEIKINSDDDDCRWRWVRKW